MSAEEVQSCLEAKDHRGEDTEEKERILARNQLETCIQWAKYLVKEVFTKMNVQISSKYCDDILSQCQEVETWLSENQVAHNIVVYLDCPNKCIFGLFRLSQQMHFWFI